MVKDKLYFDQEERLKMAWYSLNLGFWTCQFQWHRFRGCTFRCFWVMGYMYVLSWKLLITWLLWNISFREGKRNGKEGVWQRGPKWGGFFFFAKFPLSSKIQTLSHKLLVRQTSNHHHCNWHAQTPTCRDIQVILSSSSWSKQLCLCILRNKYGYQIGNVMVKDKLCFDQEEMLEMAWYSLHTGFWTCKFQWHKFRGCNFP